MIRMLLALMLALFAAPSLAQTAAAPPAPAPLPRVAIETTAGRIVVEVETVKAPVTSANFLRYVDHGKLVGVEFYRVVKLQDRYGLVQFGALGDPKRSYPPIKHEPTTLTGLSHVEGTISMARGAPGTARGEFTLMVGDQRSLDASATDVGYAAFGHVVEGMDVVVKILDSPVSPTATRLGGAYKGEVPAVPVKILSARRVAP